MTASKSCGVQRVKSAGLTTPSGQRARWRLHLACGHTVNRRQDKPPETACCEKRAREQSGAPPTRYEEQARTAMLVALAGAPGGVLHGTLLREAVIGGHVTEAVYKTARGQLIHEGLVEGLDGQRTRITNAGREHNAAKRAA